MNHIFEHYSRAKEDLTTLFDLDDLCEELQKIKSQTVGIDTLKARLTALREDIKTSANPSIDALHKAKIYLDQHWAEICNYIDPDMAENTSECLHSLARLFPQEERLHITFDERWEKLRREKSRHSSVLELSG